MIDNQENKYYTILNTNVLIIMKKTHLYHILINCKSIIYIKKAFQKSKDVKIMFSLKNENKFSKIKIYPNLADV